MTNDRLANVNLAVEQLQRGEPWDAAFLRLVFGSCHGLPGIEASGLAVWVIARYRAIFEQRHLEDRTFRRMINLWYSVRAGNQDADRLQLSRFRLSPLDYASDCQIVDASETTSALLASPDRPSDVLTAMLVEVFRGYLWQRMHNVWSADDPVAFRLEATLLRGLRTGPVVDTPDQTAERCAVAAAITELLHQGRRRDSNAPAQAVYLREWTAILQEVRAVAERTPEVDGTAATQAFDRWRAVGQSWRWLSDDRPG